MTTKPSNPTPEDERAIDEKAAAAYFEFLIGGALGKMYADFVKLPGIHAIIEDAGAAMVARTFFLTGAKVCKDEVERIQAEIDKYGPNGANEPEPKTEGGVTVVDGVKGLVKHIIKTSLKDATDKAVQDAQAGAETDEGPSTDNDPNADQAGDQARPGGKK